MRVGGNRFRPPRYRPLQLGHADSQNLGLQTSSASMSSCRSGNGFPRCIREGSTRSLYCTVCCWSKLARLAHTDCIVKLDLDPRSFVTDRSVWRCSVSSDKRWNSLRWNYWSPVQTSTSSPASILLAAWAFAGSVNDASIYWHLAVTFKVYCRLVMLWKSGATSDQNLHPFPAESGKGDKQWKLCESSTTFLNNATWFDKASLLILGYGGLTSLDDNAVSRRWSNYRVSSNWEAIMKPDATGTEAWAHGRVYQCTLVLSMSWLMTHHTVNLSVDDSCSYYLAKSVRLISLSIIAFNLLCESSLR